MAECYYNLCICTISVATSPDSRTIVFCIGCEHVCRFGAAVTFCTTTGIWERWCVVGMQPPRDVLILLFSTSSRHVPTSKPAAAEGSTCVCGSAGRGWATARCVGSCGSPLQLLHTQAERSQPQPPPSPPPPSDEQHRTPANRLAGGGVADGRGPFIGPPIASGGGRRGGAGPPPALPPSHRGGVSRRAPPALVGGAGGAVARAPAGGVRRWSAASPRKRLGDRDGGRSRNLG